MLLLLLCISSFPFPAVTDQRYNVTRGDEPILVWNKVKDTSIISATETMAIYALSTNDSDKNTLIYKDEGAKKVLLGSLFSLCENGILKSDSPFIYNESVLTVVVELEGHGFVLIRPLAEVENYNYSVIWFDTDATRPLLEKTINLTSTENQISAISILGGEQSAYIPHMAFSTDKTRLDWLPRTFLPPKKILLSFQRKDLTALRLPQYFPGSSRTVVVYNGTITFTISNRDFDEAEQFLTAGQYGYFPTVDYGVPHTERAYPLISGRFRTSKSAIKIKMTIIDNDPTTGSFDISITNNNQIIDIPLAIGSLLFTDQSFFLSYTFSTSSNTGGMIKMEIIGSKHEYCLFEGHDDGTTCHLEAYLTTDFKEAESFCLTSYNLTSGSLPTIENILEEIHLKSTLSTTFLQPYNKEDNAEVWLDWEDGGWVDNNESSYNRYKGNDTAPFLVYDRFSLTWKEPNGTAGILCRYSPNSVSSCPSFEYKKWSFYSRHNTCHSTWGYGMPFSNSDALCKVNSQSYVSLPKIQSYLENEVVYNYAMKRLDAGTTHFWLDYGGSEAVCNFWNDGEPFLYRNFITVIETEKCSYSSLCLTMLLTTKDAGKWAFMDCNSVVGLGIICSANMTSNLQR